MKKLFAIFLFFTVCKLAAQTDTTEAKPIITPYNPKGTYQTFGLTACALPWTLGNSGGIFFSLGVNYSLFKNQSIGIQATFYRTEDGRDSYSNIPAQNYNTGKKALYLNYRYYFNFNGTRETTGFIFYVGAFGRIGKLNDTWSIGFRGDSITSSKTIYYSFGALTGFSFKLKNYKYFGLDFNIGSLYNTKTVNEVYQRHIGPTNINVQFTSYDLYLSVSLCWWFYHSKINAN